MLNKLLNNRSLLLLLVVGVAVCTILLTAIGGFAWSAVGALGAKENPVQPAPIPHLSENLRNELNQALAPEFPFNFDTTGNPFADKSGVSLTSGNNNAALNAGAINPNVNPNPNGFTVSPSRPPFVRQVPPPNQMTVVEPVTIQPPILPANNQAQTTPAIDTNELIKERQRQRRLGKEVPDLASLYSIDDLRPYGAVGSGDKNRVKLYSTSTKERFAVYRGARFRDGTIESINDEEVRFRRDNGEVVLKRWMKNKEKSSGKTSPDAPILRIERQDNSQITENRPQ